MSDHEAISSRLHQLLELAAELGRVRSILLSDLLPTDVDADRRRSDAESGAGEETGAEAGSANASDGGPESGSTSPEALTAALVHLRALHLAQPEVAESIVSFLAGLGSSHARTEPGARLLDALHDSTAVEGLRRTWVALTLNTIDSEPDLSAGSWAATMLDLALAGDLEQVIAALRPQGVA